MKKHNLLKVLGICFLIVVVLTWIIPTGSFGTGSYVAGKTTPLGLFDLFRYPLLTVANFVHYLLMFLLIGGLYEVMSKTGVYTTFIDQTVKKLKGHEKLFAGITIAVLAIISSFSGLTLPLFLVVPAITTILLLLGFDKKAALLATVGAILAGTIGSTFGMNISGYVKYFLTVDMMSDLWTRIILLVIVSTLLIIFVNKTGLSTKKTEKTKTSKKQKEETNSEKIVDKVIPYYEKNSNPKRSFVPLLVVFGIGFVLILVSMINWSYVFDTKIFTDSYEAIIGLKIGTYPIIQNILGSVSAFGNWTNYDFTIILVILILVIGWLYSIKFKDLMDSVIDGAKKMLPTAIYATLACIVIAVMLSAQENIVATINNFLFTATDQFNIFTTTLAAGVNSLFYNDFPYVLNSIAAPVTTLVKDTTTYSLIGIIFQSIYGLLMFILPTSVLLVGGLVYLGIPLKEWLKYIWKFIVQVFVILLIIFVILFMFL